MIEIEINENDIQFYDENGHGWYNTEHEGQFSESICDIELIKEKWRYCPGCGRNIVIYKSKK